MHQKAEGDTLRQEENMYRDGKIYMGLADGQQVFMELNMSNRHGLIGILFRCGRPRISL